MKLNVLSLLIIPICIFFISCNDHMRPCGLKIYPSVTLVNFDTTEIDTLIVTKFDSLYAFDSVIESKIVMPLSYSFYNTAKDSIYITPFMHTYVQVGYDASSKFNFEIKFGNNRVIKFQNFIYHCGEINIRENPGEFDYCYCDYIGCKVTTNNCTSVLDKKRIYILP